MTDAELNIRVAAYWLKLSQPYDCGSHSHHTYRRLLQDFGQAAVDAALAPYIEAERAAKARRDAETVRRFYADFPTG